MNTKTLSVEDDQIVANIYRNKFSVEGYQVEVALDGQSGMEMLKTFHPDAVVLDLMLPKMTGVDFMKQVRAQSDFEHLPVIVFSNTYLTNMVQEAWKAGATKCLSKANCTPKQVIEVARGLLQPQSTPHGAAAPAHAESASDAAFQADLPHSFLQTVPST